MTDTLKNMGTKLLQVLSTALWRVLLGLVIIIVGFRLTAWLIRRFRKSKLYAKMDDSLGKFLCSVINIVAKVIVLLTAIAQMGIPITSFITMLASAGVAIGLALQGALSNLAGGVMLLLFRPFRVGDYIETVDGSGTVQEINVFYTVVLTFDNKKLTLPNGNLTASAITNYSSEPTRRVDVDFSVAMDSDMEQVKNILLTLAAEHQLVLKDPVPSCRLSNLTKSTMDFSLKVWVNNGDYWDVKYDLTEQGKVALERNGIKLSHNQLDVHIKQ